MFRFKFVTIALLISSGVAFSQNAAEANKLFENGNYEESLAAYENLLIRKPKDALYNYRYARSEYEMGDMDKALVHFEKSGNKYPLKNRYVGEIYFNRYRFEEAATALEDYFATISPADSIYQYISKQLAQAKLGANLIKRVEDVEITDSMIVDKSDFLSKIPLSADMGNIKQQHLLMHEDKQADNIRYTTQRGDRMYVSEYINGNSDLFTSYKLLNKWTDINPLNDLNTDNNENYPFLLSDGVTLYFASDCDESLGGYDIFITRLNNSDNSFLKPENIGMPFNSPFNDYMFMIDDLHGVGWFASDRYQPEGKVVIYQFIPNNEKKIVRTENTDSLINRARITDLSSATVDAGKLKKQKPRDTPSGNRIFITDKISYADENDFRSNTARNHYFTLQKLMEEKRIVDIELLELRQKYANIADQQKQSTGEKIRQLEVRSRELPDLIKQRTTQMRNAEISSLSK